MIRLADIEAARRASRTLSGCRRTSSARRKQAGTRRGIIRSAHCRAPAHILDAEKRRMVDRFLDDFADCLVSS